MQYATLYVIDPSLIGSKVLDTFPEILSYASKSNDDTAIGMIIKLDVAEIDMNFLEPEKLEEHIEGLQRFVHNYVREGIDITYIWSRTHFVSMAISCVINPKFDDMGKVISFLSKLTKAYNALLFYDNKLFDYDMEISVES